MHKSFFSIYEKNKDTSWFMGALHSLPMLEWFKEDNIMINSGLGLGVVNAFKVTFQSLLAVEDSVTVNTQKTLKGEMPPKKVVLDLIFAIENDSAGGKRTRTFSNEVRFHVRQELFHGPSQRSSLE